MLSKRTIETPVGKLFLTASDVALTELFFENHRAEVDGLDATPPPIIQSLFETNSPHTILDLAESQLNEYFSGNRQSFSIPLEPAGTDFQRDVWAELQNIPFGKTISYIELARCLGDEKKTRAVGLANGKNPISIVIPCHRVIGANGHLVGYGG
jgi:methylated-DNA-[protein]-cysteine S-methyltransferase